MEVLKGGSFPFCPRACSKCVRKKTTPHTPSQTFCCWEDGAAHLSKGTTVTSDPPALQRLHPRGDLDEWLLIKSQ